MPISILDKCTGCGSCVAVCPYSALTLETDLPNGFGSKKAVVNIGLCCDCGDCIPVCLHQAISPFNESL
ncbi:MAG: 4Fe-4S dicluster domain-containing protein [Desulfuromusa sp.]|nr:4Fe-4S dicluster domain-containing protein [Desulfuromusa sp.]